MGRKNPQAFDDLTRTLFTDSAVAGEVAGYAMGLVLPGNTDTASADEILTYAGDSMRKSSMAGLLVLGSLYLDRLMSSQRYTHARR